jgi:hypothetical protein
MFRSEGVPLAATGFTVSRRLAFAIRGSHPGAPLVRLLGLLDFVSQAATSARCRPSALDNPRSGVACRGNTIGALATLYLVVLDAEQSQAQLEKGHCAVNVHLQARIEALLGRLGTRSGRCSVLGGAACVRAERVVCARAFAERAHAR